jgi:hypothetical protein
MIDCVTTSAGSLPQALTYCMASDARHCLGRAGAHRFAAANKNAAPLCQALFRSICYVQHVLAQPQWRIWLTSIGRPKMQNSPVHPPRLPRSVEARSPAEPLATHLLY